MSDTEIALIANPVVQQRGNSCIEHWPLYGRWYWELRLDDQEHGEAIAGPACSHRAAVKAIRRAARREGIT